MQEIPSKNLSWSPFLGLSGKIEEGLSQMESCLGYLEYL